MPERKYNSTQVSLMKEQYLSGIDTVQIANFFGTYNTTIRRILIREGVSLRSFSEARRIVKGNPFQDLTKDTVQYWLGYLMSDGNISEERNRINLSTNKDPEHLKRYVEFLKSDVKISKYRNKRFEVDEYSVNFASIEVKNFLIDLGITPRKSLTLNLKIPLTYSILRGYLDGNGCRSNFQFL
jgi:hypothetical protein